MCHCGCGTTLPSLKWWMKTSGNGLRCSKFVNVWRELQVSILLCSQSLDRSDRWHPEQYGVGGGLKLLSTEEQAARRWELINSKQMCFTLQLGVSRSGPATERHRLHFMDLWFCHVSFYATRQWLMGNKTSLVQTLVEASVHLIGSNLRLSK